MAPRMVSRERPNAKLMVELLDQIRAEPFLLNRKKADVA
jgi:hypothetical protein